jgi:hypothetical protein
MINMATLTTNVTIGDKEYKLNITEALKLKILSPIVKRQVGQQYQIFTRFGDSKGFYILANVSGTHYDSPKTVALINVVAGDRWSAPTVVRNVHDISDSEWTALIDPYTDGFESKLVALDFVVKS